MKKATQLYISSAFAVLALSSFGSSALAQGKAAPNDHVRLFVGVNAYDQHTEGGLSSDKGNLRAVSLGGRLMADSGWARGLFVDAGYHDYRGDTQFKANPNIELKTPIEKSDWRLKIGAKLPIGSSTESFVGYGVIGGQQLERTATLGEGKTIQVVRQNLDHSYVGAGILASFSVNARFTVELDAALAQTRDVRNDWDGEGAPEDHGNHTQTMLGAAVTHQLGHGWGLRYSVDFTQSVYGRSKPFTSNVGEVYMARIEQRDLVYGISALYQF